MLQAIKKQNAYYLIPFIVIYSEFLTGLSPKKDGLKEKKYSMTTMLIKRSRNQAICLLLTQRLTLKTRTICAAIAKIANKPDCNLEPLIARLCEAILQLVFFQRQCALLNLSLFSVFCKHALSFAQITAKNTLQLQNARSSSIKSTSAVLVLRSWHLGVRGGPISHAHGCGTLPTIYFRENTS